MVVRRRLLALVVAAAVGSSFGQAEAGETREPDVVLEEAKRTKSRVLFMFTADWCSPCRHFKKRILPSERVRDALKGLQLVVYDIETPVGKRAASQFGARSVPTFVAFDTTGTERDRQKGIGDGTPKAFAEFLRRAKVSTRSLEAMQKRLAESPENAESLLQMARWYRARDRVPDAVRYYARVEAAAGPRSKLAARAAWESTLLQGADERVRRVVEESVAYAKRYPGTDLALRAVTRAVLSGQLAEQAQRELIALHAKSMAENDERLHQLTMLALAAGTFEEALQVAERFKAQGQDRFRGYLALAVVHLFRGDFDRARNFVPILRAWVVDHSDRLHLGDLTRRLRARERRWGDVTALLQETKGFFDALRDPERVRQPESNRDSPALRGFERFHAATEKALRWTGKRCAKSGGGLREVWVHLKLGAADEPPDEVTILDRDAGARLRRCIKGALRKRKLPAAVWLPDRRLTARIRLPRVRHALPGVPPPELSNQSYLFLRGTTGLERSLGAGLLVDVAGRRLADLFGTVMLDAHIGAAAEGRAVYGATVLGGLAFARDRVRVSLQGGLGVSKPGAMVEHGIEIPAQIAVSVSGKVHGLAWVRASWLLAADTRKRGSVHAPQSSDELRLGLGARLPRFWGRQLFAGIAMTQAVEQTGAALLIGTNLD